MALPPFALSYFRRRWRQRLLSLSMTLLLCLSPAALWATSNQNEILWDDYRVPHIYAQSDRDLFYGFGWAQAHSHLNLLLKLYGQSRGRAAEYWGQDYWESDRWVRTMGIPKRASQWYEQQTPEFRRHLDAFVNGINAYAQAHPEALDQEVQSVLPIQGVDLLSHLQRLLHFTFVVSPQDILHLQDASDPATASESLGSNAWAIAPSRSASGHTLLLANPHTPWNDLFRWYEADLKSPDFDLYGASFVGVPVLNLGFDHDHGWTHTVNTYDGWDAYQLTLKDGGYEWNNGVRAFETESQAVKIRRDNDQFETKTLNIVHSVHGPIVSQSQQQAIALRVVGLDQPHALEQWWNMGKAHTLKDFERALKALQIPMFSVLYGDRQGHIFHLFNGQVPIRGSGTYEEWQNIMAGNTSETLWTHRHPYEDLPKIQDPPTGWLQNANDPPWSTTFRQLLSPDDYPPYLAPRGPIAFRAQRSLQMLMKDSKITFDELIADKHSTQMALADRIVDDLIAAAQQWGNDSAQEAANILEQWDHQANAESRGAALFNFWYEAMDSESLFAQAWDEALPLTTPDGLANPIESVRTLEKVAQQMRNRYGRLDQPWGEIFRLKTESQDLPASGGYGDLGIFRTIEFESSDTHQYQATGGDSFVAAIEFSNPVRAKALLSYGNSTQVKPDDDPQWVQMSQQELRPVWRSRREIQQHLIQRESFKPH